MYPSLVLSVGLTDLPSPLCLYPPISMVKSLQDACVLKPYCCLKGRRWRREGVRAWQPGAVFLLGRLQQGQRTSSVQPCGMAWVLRMGYFPWEACWGGWRVAEAGLADLLGKMEMLK